MVRGRGNVRVRVRVIGVRISESAADVARERL